MPSPLAHSAMGYLLGRMIQQIGFERYGKLLGPKPTVLLVTAGLSLLPDIDSIPGVIFGDFGRYHNNAMHSLITGLFIALGMGGAVWCIKRTGFAAWFLVSLLCYELHILMDYATIGRGVMLFWPFSLVRYSSPYKLFYGLHWSDGWLSIRHLWTLLTEFGFVLCIGLLVHQVLNKHAKFDRV